MLTAPDANAGVASAATQEIAVGLDARQTAAAEGVEQARARLLPRLALRDHLGEQRIVVGRDLAAAIDGRLDPHAVGEHHLGQQARAGLEVALRILGVDAGLDGGAPARAAPPRGSDSPAATRTIHSTMSTPVTSSVTPCSTWMRVLTSRK